MSFNLLYHSPFLLERDEVFWATQLIAVEVGLEPFARNVVGSLIINVLCFVLHIKRG